MKVDLTYALGGKKETFAVERLDGRLPKPDWSSIRATDLIVSDHVQKELAQALTLGVTLGMEEIPLLGDSIYNTNLNSEYPEIIPGSQFLGAECVFAEIKEGEEIMFGHVVKKVTDVLQIFQYAVGLQVTKRAEIFGQAGVVLDEWSRACGRAWNALRNNLRFYPIISETLTGDNLTTVVYKKADYSTGTAGDYVLEPTIYATLTDAIRKAALMKRPAPILLCCEADRLLFEEALSGYRTLTTSKPSLPIAEVVVYDGDTLYVGGETFSYTGVTTGTAYIIRPKAGFFERRKQDLLIDVGIGDRSRFISKEVVADALLGIQANVLNNVQKITFPTS